MYKNPNLNKNPSIQNGSESIEVLNELLVAHEKYLPQFKENIRELKKQGVESKDPVVIDLMKHGH